MKYRSGFLEVLCACMMILMQSLDARHAPKKYPAGVSCRARKLTALTESLVIGSLTSFDEANGKNLGTWLPGFPELEVNQNSSLNGSKVQCSILFMVHGLEKVLQDQKNNLNPLDASLHAKLTETISRVKMLAVCLKEVLEGECSPTPPPPKMPKPAFDRKQWSRTLLKMARDYLHWLESKLPVQISKVIGKNKVKHVGNEANHQSYFEGSGYLL